MELQVCRTRLLTAVLLSLLGAIPPRAQAATTPVVKLVIQPDPAVQGSVVTLFVSAQPPTGAAVRALPSGQITVLDSSSCASNQQLGIVTLDSTGAGQLTVSTWSCIGANTLVASYAGDSNYLPASSSAVIETILSQYTQTTATLSSSQNPSTVGQAVTVGATLNYTLTLLTRPTGTVTFTDTNTNTVLGSAPVITGSGTHTVTGASTTLSSLPVGSYAIQAAYSGDNIYAASVSPIVNQVVQRSAPAATATSLTVSAGRVTQGTPLTFTATVTSSAGDIPAGPVTFTADGTTILGVVSLNSVGMANLSISTLAIGMHSVVASYGGSGTDGASSSSSVSVTETAPPPATTTTTLTPSANPVTATSTIGLTARVTSAAVGTPTGTVQFFDGATPLATVAIDQTGTAVVAKISLGAGVHFLSADYSGDSNFAGSQGTYTETVNAPPPPAPNPTTTSISSSANPSVFGQTVTITASVAVTSGVATGSVTFTIGSTSTQVPLDIAGTATLTTAVLSVGSNNVTASYSGDAANAASVSATLIVTVNQAPTTTTITSSASQSASVQTVTFTATVTVNAPGSGTPTGSVSFVADGSNTVCTSPLQTGGTAVCSTNGLAPASHTIVATYGGDSNFATSNAQTQFTVGLEPTTTVVTGSPNPSVFGQAVTFTAAVTVNAPGSGTPTGTVLFQSDGSNPLCTNVPLTNGTASCSISSLAIGGHMITANYGADKNFAASYGVMSQNVNQAATSTAVTSSQNPSVFGQPVTFIATVTITAPASGIPTGSVTFIADSSATMCARVPLGPNATAVCTVNTLLTGMHAVTATYSGDGNLTGSGGQTSQTVNKDPTSTTLTNSANSVVEGQTVTFTATIAANPPGSGTPTGTASFADGTNLLCANVAVQSGAATCTWSPLSAGLHSITVTYPGDSSFLASSNSTQVTVNVPDAAATADLAISEEVAERKVAQGQRDVYRIRITNIGPNSASIVVMNDALPPGAAFEAVRVSAGSCAVPAIGANGPVSCTTPLLEPGRSWQIWITWKDTAPRGRIVTNTVTVGSATQDSGHSDKSASVSVHVVPAGDDGPRLDSMK